MDRFEKMKKDVEQQRKQMFKIALESKKSAER